jgi:signal peptidase I
MISPLARLPKRTRGWIRFGLWIIAAAIVGLLLATFVARSYNVDGISMEPTLHTGDVVFTNRLARTWSDLTHQQFAPKRGQLAVFKNPFYNRGDPNLFIVKRVIGLPGDHVVVRDGRITVYTAMDPIKAFNPDTGINGPQSPTNGAVDRVVPDGELFVVGDNRQGKNSLDSRNGMSTVPIAEVQGTVLFRFWPLNSFRIF